MPHAQLTTNERYAITHLHHAGVSNAEIARRLNRHRGTIGRELARNRDASGYHYLSSEYHAQQRRKQANTRYKLDELDMQGRVRHWLIVRWSPQQIAGRLKREFANEPTKWVSHETIYQWIYRQYKQGHRW
ncbi:IS30 family transposase, partial [bacterium AH-315-I18]|nr:IS30 family transposase [bacterium AH-315-I18]